MRVLSLRDPAFLGNYVSPTFWFYFPDETTVAIQDSQVVEVANKGTPGWSLTKSATGFSYVTGINGKKCLDLGAPGHSNFLRNTSPMPIQIAEIWIVLDANFTGAFSNYNGLITATADSYLDDWFVDGNYNSSRFYFKGFDSMYINGQQLNPSSDDVLPAINSPALLRIKRLDNSSLTSNLGIQIGNDRNNASRGWGGLIGEIRIFPQSLANVDALALQSEIAADWNLTLV